MLMTSTGPSDSMVTLASAPIRQLALTEAAERTMWNVLGPTAASAAAPPIPAPPIPAPPIPAPPIPAPPNPAALPPAVRSGPAWSGKLFVLSACTPALCSPLNGVVAPAQPAATASFGELNHRPRWYICTGLKGGLVLASGKGPLKTWGAAAEPGATAKVSTLKRPTKMPLAWPDLLLSRSPWYQEIPNGALGTWVTNRSKSVFGGR